MARTIYSALLGQATSVTDEWQELGGPEPGYTWVVREAFMTYGTEFGSPQGGLCLNNEDPRLWLFYWEGNKIATFGKTTVPWIGDRLVVPDGSTLWVATYSGLVADFYVSGYKLLNS